MAMILARSALGILGIILLYIGLCVEDDQGKPDSRLERLARQIQTQQRSAMDLQAYYLRTVSESFASYIDRLFIIPSKIVGLSVLLCALPNAVFFMFDAFLT